EADWAVPTRAKRSFSCWLVVEKGRFPTKSFLPIDHSLPDTSGRALARRGRVAGPSLRQAVEWISAMRAMLAQAALLRPEAATAATVLPQRREVGSVVRKV